MADGARRRRRPTAPPADLPPEGVPTSRMLERLRRSAHRDDPIDLRVVYADVDQAEVRERALAILGRLLDRPTAPGKA